MPGDAVRHRNDTERPLTVATDPPMTVDVGEVVDLPDHIAGLTCLDEPCPVVVGEPGPELPAPDGDVVTPRPGRARTRTADAAEEA